MNNYAISLSLGTASQVIYICADSLEDAQLFATEAYGYLVTSVEEYTLS
ncbi:hypothetical protein [Zhongshania sp.]